ncbi:MAG: hypothetical protein K5985_08595 [Lachnospiraceae bacterium]|nr:hypothetical protein [Lachnospiraceae bacterium]
MELTVYRQSSKTRPDGTIVYKGEDALPFVGESLFLVADGLGGAAAIRHQNILPGMFDAEALPDILFKDVFEDYSDNVLLKYVRDSFFELFAVKDCYTANVNNIKKSGYFASRIVAAILLHEFLHDPQLKKEVLFELMEASDSREARERAESALGERLAERISDCLKKIAANCSLTYESSYSGLALLGTTLCATLYEEKEDRVDAIYFTAGDSRPYIWTEEDGLCQLLPDEEGEDGGMTNYIKANEDAQFHIRCNYFSFNKPCVLFNASDGCFDSGYFLSQLAFERLILTSGTESGGTEELSAKLHDFFLECGRHDDSSTIAMKFFGFEDFEAFKESARRRMKVIEERFLSKLPELLERDYISEYGKLALKTAETVTEEGPEDIKAASDAVSPEETPGEAVLKGHNVIAGVDPGSRAEEVKEPAAEVKAEDGPTDKELEELKEKAQLQEKLFEEYQASYGRYLAER